MSASSPPENAPPADPVPLPYGTVPRGEAPSEPYPTTPVPTPPSAGPSRGLAALAALLPVVFTMFSCVLFAVSGEGPSALGSRIQEMGVVALLAILVSAGTAVVGTTVLLALSARGWRVPSVIAVALGSLPWLAGLLGAWHGLSLARQAVQNADPSSRATMMAMGISEAIHARILGASLASGLLAAVAVGLAIGAVAQGAPGRRPLVGAGIGLAVSLPLLAVTLYGLLGVGLAGVILPIAGLGAALAIVLAAAAPGTDAPNGRSGAMAAAVPVAAGLSIGAAMAVASSAAFVEIFSALAYAEPASRSTLLLAAAAELRPLATADRVSMVLALLAAAAVAGWGASRMRPSLGRLPGAVAVLLAFGLMFGLDSWTMRSSTGMLEGLTQQPWRDVPDLEPVTLPDDRHAAEVNGLVTPRGLLRPDGAALAELEQSALTRGLEVLAPGPSPREDDAPRPLVRTYQPRLALLLDARLSALQLLALFEAARANGIQSLILAGERSGSPSPAERSALAASLPMLAAFGDGNGSVHVFLSTSRQGETTPELDPILYHVIVGATPPRRVQTRPGARVTEQERELVRDERDYYGDSREQDRPLYVALGPDANARSLMETIAAAESRGFAVIVVPGEIPGRPAAPLDLGGGNAGFGGLSVAASDRVARVRLGVVTVRGSLSSDVVRRVIRRHTPEIRLCYTEELRASPDLEGRVTLSFIISATGAVMTERVMDSTLDHAALETCLLTAARGWTFPAPDGGGIVGVNVPFLLAPTP